MAAGAGGVEASLQREPFRGDLLDRLLALCAGFAEEATIQRRGAAHPPRTEQRAR